MSRVMIISICLFGLIGWGIPSGNAAINPAHVAVFQDGNVTLFPNPATDKIYFRSESYIILEVEIYDILGQKLKTYNYGSGTKEGTLDIADLEDGIFIVQMKTFQGNIISKTFKKLS